MTQFLFVFCRQAQEDGGQIILNFGVVLTQNTASINKNPVLVTIMIFTNLNNLLTGGAMCIIRVSVNSC